MLGCYGDPVARTPHLDALAARGTRFASAYCQTPICVPSRASLATGRWAHELESWDNASPYTGAHAPSWGHRLTAAGHRVVTVGKLHYRATEDPTGFPEQRLPLHILQGAGDLYGLLRGEMPVRPQSRRQLLEARAGESEYTRYDRAIAAEAAAWLKREAPREKKPWTLFVGFVTPHFPLVAPPEYLALYPPERLPPPLAGAPEEWPQHPALAEMRRKQALDAPLAPAELARARAAYYALVSFMDAQVGVVLEALREAGLEDDTRVIYSSDHGDMAGEHGLWFKCCMYEGAVGVPLLCAGPDVPPGKVVHTNAMLVDVVPTLLDSAGLKPDAELRGKSLLALANEPDAARTAFSEFHAIFSSGAIFMLREERYKYVHYVGYPPQLFDLHADPEERRDLAADAAHAEARRACERALRAIVDPEAIDRRARADQRRRVDAAGGPEAVKARGVRVVYTPAPQQFVPSEGGGTR